MQLGTLMQILVVPSLLNSVDKLGYSLLHHLLEFLRAVGPVSELSDAPLNLLAHVLSDLRFLICVN